MNPHDLFLRECKDEISTMADDQDLHGLTLSWITAAQQHKYSYHFSWFGRPIIQYPQDIVAMQELIWEVKPDLIIETGIARGGSLIFSATMLALLDMAEAMDNASLLQPQKSTRKVLGIDIDIRTHNRESIEAHPFHSYISMIEGSSIDNKIIRQVEDFAKGYERILVCLDSNHTAEHVLKELKAYARLASISSYCVVFDTIIERFPKSMFHNRPWARGDNPMTAVQQFLSDLQESEQFGAEGNRLKFEVVKEIENKLLITVAPNGYLRRIP